MRYGDVRNGVILVRVWEWFFEVVPCSFIPKVADAIAGI